MRSQVGTMKHKHLHGTEDSLTPDEPTLDISSLIDVCFLLLIYFLVTTTIQPREQDLNTNLPGAPSESIVLMPPMVIQVMQGGEVVVNPGDAAEVYDADVESRELPNLKERLKSLAGLGRINVPSVLLKIHDDVQQQRYIDVLNCLAGAGISDIALQD